jgi:hypothetical protein
MGVGVAQTSIGRKVGSGVSDGAELAVGGSSGNVADGQLDADALGDGTAGSVGAWAPQPASATSTAARAAPNTRRVGRFVIAT